MSVYSIWPFFACMAVLLAIVISPAFNPADTPPNPHQNRISTLDGLRGFLALGVFFHHVAIYDKFLLGGPWALPPSRFYTLLGQVGVAMFFMITGYLFWLRLIEARGQPNWLQLYIGRVFRICPLYFFAIAAMLTVVFAKTGLHLNVPLIEIAKEICKWLAFGFFGWPNVNAYAGTPQILAGVTWTLQYEWLFYFSLLFTAYAARHARMHLIFAVSGLVACVAYTAWHFVPSVVAPTSVSAALFFAGMVCASLEKSGLSLKLPDWVASVLVLALIGGVFFEFSTANRAAPVIILGLAFYLVANGCTVFGLLSSRAAHRLGNVSYGIYLLQGLVLGLVFSFEPIRIFALVSPAQYWAVGLLSAILLTAGATITHLIIERTGIEVGKKVGTALGAKWGQLKSVSAPTS